MHEDTHVMQQDSCVTQQDTRVAQQDTHCAAGHTCYAAGCSVTPGPRQPRQAQLSTGKHFGTLRMPRAR